MASVHEGLDACDLHRLVGPRHEPGLNNPVLDAAFEKLARGLFDNLPRVGEHQHCSPGGAAVLMMLLAMIVLPAPVGATMMMRRLPAFDHAMTFGDDVTLVWAKLDHAGLRAVGEGAGEHFLNDVVAGQRAVLVAVDQIRSVDRVRQIRPNGGGIGEVNCIEKFNLAGINAIGELSCATCEDF